MTEEKRWFFLCRIVWCYYRKEEMPDFNAAYYNNSYIQFFYGQCYGQQPRNNVFRKGIYQVFKIRLPCSKSECDIITENDQIISYTIITEKEKENLKCLLKKLIKTTLKTK